MKELLQSISKLKSSLLKSKFTLDTIWLIGAQVVLVFSGLAINLIVAGKYGATELGVFNQVLGYYAVLSSIFALGLNSTLIKKISSLNNDEATESSILSSVLTLTLLSSTILSGAVIYIAHFHDHLFSSKELAQAIVIPFFSLPIYSLNKNFMAFFTGKRMQKDFSLIRTFRWVLIIAFIGIAILLKQEINTLYYCFLFAETCLLLYAIIKLFKSFTIKFDFDLVKQNLSFGLKSFSAELFAVFNDKFDLLILGYFLSNAEVGIYSFFIFFAKSLYIFPGILQQNFNPIVSNYWENNKLQELQQKINSVRKINAMVVLAQSIALVFVYYILISFFRQEFKDSMYLMIISLVGVIPSALVTWSGAMLIMTGKLRENIIRTFLIMTCSMAGTFCFSYLYGLLGATIAVGSGSIISFFILKIYIQKSLNLKVI